MCTPLAKLAIGLWATMATGFYYLAAAPPASAAIDVCGPGNYSSACAPDNTPSPGAPATQPDPQPASQSLRDAASDLPEVESPPVVADPVPPSPEVPSPPVIPDQVPDWPEVPSPPVIPVIPDQVPQVPAVPPGASIPEDPVQPSVGQQAPSPTFPKIYTNAPAVRSTSIPEPGTAIALLLTGAGMICSGRKRNKQVGQQR